MFEYPEAYISIKDFAKYMRVHHNTIRRAIKNKRLQAVNVGSGNRKIWRIPISEIHRLTEFDLANMIPGSLSKQLAKAIQIANRNDLPE